MFQTSLPLVALPLRRVIPVCTYRVFAARSGKTLRFFSPRWKAICRTHQRETLASPTFCRQRVSDIDSAGNAEVKMNLTLAFSARDFSHKLKLVKSTNTENKVYIAEFYHYGESYRFNGQSGEIIWLDAAYRLVFPLWQVALVQLYNHHQSGNSASGKLVWKLH